MEKMPEPIENPDYAWEAAHAEKPLRDIAQEDWVDKNQKENLEGLANTRAEEALKQLLAEELPKTPENNSSENFTIEDVASVITAKGSRYDYLPDGTTQRFKKVENKTYGPQSVLVYVPDYEWIKKNVPSDQLSTFGDDAGVYEEILLEYRGKGKKTYIVDQQGHKLETNDQIRAVDGNIFLTFGDSEKVDFMIPVSVKPRIGFYTYDTRKYKDEKTGEMMRERHFGNQVVEIILKKDENSVENQEQSLIEKGVELIKTNPNVEFIISANGNVLAVPGGETRGNEDIYFDKGEQKMKRVGPQGFNTSLDYPVREISTEDKNLVNFKPYWKFVSNPRENGTSKQLPYNLIMVRLPFNPSVKNPYSKESRPGTHLSFGLAYRNDIPNVTNSFGDELLKQYLQQPNTPEAKRFFGNLFNTVAKEFIPQYYRAFIEELNAQKQ